MTENNPSPGQILLTNHGTYIFDVPWTPPPEYTWRLNLAIHVTLGSEVVGAGWVLRNEYGIFKGAQVTRVVNYINDTTIVTLISLLNVIEIVNKIGVDYLEIETEDMTAILLLTGHLESTIEPIKGLIVEYKKYLKEFRSVTFVHIFEHANKVAMYFAEKVIEVMETRTWSIAPPTEVINILTNDMLGRWNLVDTS